MSDMRPTSLPAIGFAGSSSIAAPRLKIAVVANAGNTNLGDEAVLSSTLAALRDRLVDANIRVYSVNPPDTAERHGVDSAPLRSRVTSRLPASRPREHPDPLRTVVRRIPVVAPILRASVRCIRYANRLAREPAFIVRSWRRLRETDLLMIAGSNQLEDWFGGPWGYPYTILLWTVLARLAGAPVAFVSVGAGPLSASLSRWMCVRALRLAAYASFRDAESLNLMRDLGYRGTGSVVPDLAFALALGEPETRPKGVPPRIAINVYPYRDPQYDPTETDGGAGFAGYVDTFARFVVAANARGLQPVLFGSQRADARVLDLVQERLLALAPNLGEVERHMPATLAGLIAVIDGSDFVVATRYHAILFGVFRGRPTFGICYQSKSQRLLEMAGLGEYAVDAEGLNAGALLDQVAKAIAAGDGNGHIHARAMALHAECNRGFDAALEKSLPGWIVASRVP